MIEICNVVKKYDNQIVLNNINLNIKENEKVLFIGQNGAGKSTLLKTILGHIRTDSGFVKINNFSPLTQRKEALKLMSFVPQNPPPLKFTIEEIIKLTTSSTNAKKNDVFKFSKMLDFDINSNLKKPFYKLSGGMKQKFLISIAFARESRIFIFDEPTANLDVDSRRVFSEILSTKTDKTMIFVSHRLKEMKQIVNRIVEFDLAKVVRDEKI